VVMVRIESRLSDMLCIDGLCLQNMEILSESCQCHALLRIFLELAVDLDDSGCHGCHFTVPVARVTGCSILLIFRQVGGVLPMALLQFCAR